MRLLLDCGSGVVHRMASLGVDWLGITHLALTHFHPDHTLDLTTLFYAWRYGTLPRARRRWACSAHPVRWHCSRASPSCTARCLTAPPWPLEIAEIPFGGGADLGGGVRLDTLKVPHTEESVAYSIVRGARRIVYTGDTGVRAARSPMGAGVRRAAVRSARFRTAMAIPDASHARAVRRAGRARACRGCWRSRTSIRRWRQDDIRAAVAARYFSGPSRSPGTVGTPRSRTRHAGRDAARREAGRGRARRPA